MQQIDVIRWGGQEIPIMAASRNGQAVGFPFVRFNDMPSEFREALNKWARDVRTSGFASPSSEYVYLDDVEEYLTWEQWQNTNADSAR